jgi:hypothetical protein
MRYTVTRLMALLRAMILKMSPAESGKPLLPMTSSTRTRLDEAASFADRSNPL